MTNQDQKAKPTKEAAPEIVKNPQNPEEIKKDKKEFKRKPKFETTVEWKPRTEIGKKVFAKQITSVEEILDAGNKIMEPEIVDALVPNLDSELLLIGQSKGKFGGGQRRVFKQTQKKTREGNKPSFATMAIVGNKNGYIGLGAGKSKETVPARDKAIRNAKLNLIKIRRGSGSWESSGRDTNSIPFQVEGKNGLSKIVLIPAPKGVGLCIEKECAKMLQLAGIEDIWSKTYGQTKTKINLLKACFNALKQTMEIKVPYNFEQEKTIVEGAISQRKVEEEVTNE